MEAIEKLTNTMQKNSNANIKPRIVLIFMIYCAFAISGIVEHGITVALSPFDQISAASEIKQERNLSLSRRYCDPPNMTAMVIYYDSIEEANVDDNYDFEQLQEMYFRTNLSFHEEMDILLKNFYLWGNFFSSIPASRLAVNIGSKKVLGYSLLGAAASTLLVPAAWLTDAHVILRFFQGLFCGALIPAAHSLAVNWFPQDRRSSFVSLYSAKYMGYALCELLTVKFVQIFGSGSIYYITGIITIIWFVPWSMIVFDTPEKHLKYTGRQKKPTFFTPPNSLKSKEDFPVKQFLCSRPVWMSAGVIFGAYCGQISINMGMRLYLKYVYNITDSFLTFIPFILHSLFALLCGYLVDFIQETKFVSVTSSRRMFVYISHFIPAGLIFILGFVGCGNTPPILLYSLSIIVSGAFYSGALCSPIDIGPNHAATAVAFCYTFGVAGSLVMCYLLSSVLDGKVLGSWRFTFSLTSLILLISAIFFMLRGSGAIQSWNSNSNNEEMKMNIKNDQQRHSIIAPLPSKPRTRSIYAVEQKILKVLYVQEPEKFRRVRAYSTSLPNERSETSHPNIHRNISKKRASIS